MKLLIGFRHDGKEFYFRKGISFSHTGIYSPTFRIGCKAIFDTAGSSLFPIDNEIDNLLCVLNSKIVLCIFKSFINNTVNTSEDPLKQISVSINYPNDLKCFFEYIIKKQSTNNFYDYASHEQIEIDKLVYEAYGLSTEDVQEVENWYARRYSKLSAAQKANLRALGKSDDYLELYGMK